MSFRIGRVLHYYDKIGVAIIELDADLVVGETIRFVRGGEDLFEQKVESIQIEHEKVSAASKGDVIGIKLVQGVKEDAQVYKI